jgi:bilin biosynthesis protein
MPDTPSLIDPAYTDALLARVDEQITLDTFDPTDSELMKELVSCLGDGRGLARLRVAETLGEIGESATPFLLDALQNEDVIVRRTAAKTLTIIADEQAVSTLIHTALNDEDTVVRASSVGALARIGEAAVPPLLEILSTPTHSETTKGLAAWALAFMGAEAKEYLYPALQSDSPEVRAAVVGAIAKVAQEEPKAKLFELLIQALSDTDEDVRCEAAAALGNVGYQPAVPHLLNLLSHDAGEMRRAAALALMKIGDGGAIAPLTAALAQESEAGVQSVLKLAISQLEKRIGEDS